MTLKDQYTIKNKKRIKQFIFIYSFLIIFFVVYSTIAKYEHKSEGYTKIALANWKISLNGQELKQNGNTMTDVITLKDENNSPKIMPGQSGFFDIEINPTDTEVSFWYQISLDLENSVLPDGLSISKYSFDDGKTTETLQDNNQIRKTVLLENKKMFTANDIQKIRYYWDWDFGEDEDKVYTIVVNVELKQII